MSFLKKIQSFFRFYPQTNALWIYVQCKYCHEPLKTRVNLASQLSVYYDKKGITKGYFCRKTIIGSHGCYRPIEVELNFDANKRLVGKEINGGSFLTEQEYDELLKARESESLSGEN